jgi:hypothetical protein
VSDESHNETEAVANNAETTPMPGGITGKGFVPGDPRINRSGRPHKKLITEAFEQMLEEKLGDPEARAAFLEAHWAKLLSKGVVSAMLLEKMLDRTEGKLTQPVDVSGQIDIVQIIEEGRKRLG